MCFNGKANQHKIVSEDNLFVNVFILVLTEQEHLMTKRNPPLLSRTVPYNF